jgi:spore coat polysaccharide biosynthesis predicted glycosyltransferase SpsG
MVAFFIDGGKEKGYGHLVREDILAHELLNKGIQVAFICTHRDALRYLDNKGFTHVFLAEPDNLLEKLLPLSPSILISDRTDTLSPKVVDELHQRNIFVIEFDRADGESWADEVVNGFETVLSGASSKQFRLVGKDYFVVNPVFALMKQSKKQKAWQTDPTLFTCFGGSDPSNLLEPTLRILSDIPDYRDAEIHAVVGFEGGKMKVIREEYNVLKNPHLYANADATLIARLMSISHLCIIPFGTLLIEALTVEAPVFMINPSKAHEDYAKKVLKTIFEGVGETFGYHPVMDWEKLSQRFLFLRKNPEDLHKMSNASKGIVDGKGAYRVANFIHSLLVN